MGGTLALTASAQGGLSATQQETVNGVSALVFATAPQSIAASQTPQTSGLLTLQLHDNNGNAAAAPDGGLTVELRVNGGTLPLPSVAFLDANNTPLSSDGNGVYSLTISAGSDTVSFKFQGQSTQTGAFVLNVSIPGSPLTAQQVATIQAGPLSSLKFETAAQSLITGIPSIPITVKLMDPYGNAVSAGSGEVTVHLSSTSSSGQFLSDGGDLLAGSSVTIRPGASSATFLYKDSQLGTPTLTATANGFSTQQQETVNPLSSAIHVTTTADSGDGSLREAMTQAFFNPGSTIVFDVTGTIDLLSALPPITGNTNIVGPGADKLTIERSASASDTFGGFVSLGNVQEEQLSSVTIAGLTVANFNDTGIANIGGDLTLRQVVVRNNNASEANLFPDGDPGGILNYSGVLTVLGSTIADNSTSNSSVDAGIFSEYASLTLINSTIAGNVAHGGQSGGGIGIFVGSAYIANSTISGNTATQQPGAMNSGGIEAGGTVTLYNTIVAGNTGSPDNPIDVFGAFNSLGFNLIGAADGNSSSGFVSSDLVGTTAKPIDAKLDSLADNGGPTPTMALRDGSPALGAGSSANAPATDQRGVARPQQGAIDIGAFERTTFSGVAPSITQQPTSQSATVGTNVSFTAQADGTPAPTVQWQVRSYGQDWSDIDGATSRTLTLKNVNLGHNGNQYRAVFSNGVGENAISEAATLTVKAATAAPPTITRDPMSQSATVGANVSFTAEADGTPAPTVQWQVRSDGQDWSDIDGATSSTLRLTQVTIDMSGHQYRAVFSNGVGNAAISEAATLTVNAATAAPSITTGPTDTTVTVGQTATFTAEADGTPTPTVQWQVRSDGQNWSDIDGATNSTLLIAKVSLDQNGNQYRAVFSNGVGENAIGEAATLTVNAATAAPTITTQPSDTTVTAGANVSFTAEANGTPTPTVQWQVRSEGQDWSDIDGATSSTLLIAKVSLDQNGNQYRAVFSNGVGENAIGEAATLTVKVADSTITFDPLSLSSGTVGTAYSETITVSSDEGISDISYHLTFGVIPNGMQLTRSGNQLILSGKPTEAGRVSFDVIATAGNGDKVTKSYTLIVNSVGATIVLDPDTLPVGTVGTTYGQTITANGGFGATTVDYQITAGVLPEGLRITKNGNVLSIAGTPAASGSVNFLVTAWDEGGDIISSSYLLTVLPSDVRPEDGSNGDGTTGGGGSIDLPADQPTPAQLQQAAQSAFTMTVGLLSGNPLLFVLGLQQFQALPAAAMQQVGQIVHSQLMQALMSGMAESNPHLVDVLFIQDGLLNNNLLYVALGLSDWQSRSSQ